MRSTIWYRTFLPLLLSYLLLFGAALLLDYALHGIGMAWVGRYLGIAGTLLILISFAYSLRKRGAIHRASPRRLLRLHEVLGWLGPVMILVHSGIHFNAILPWLAATTMMIVVASGHLGKFLLRRARQGLEARRSDLHRVGLTDAEIEQRLFLDSIAVNVLNQWRTIHIPVVMLFATLSLVHILSILFFWNG